MRLILTEWHRQTFAIQIFPRHGSREPRAELATGWVSGPFFVFAGDLYRVGHETPGRKVYSLIHMPTQSVQLTLPRAGLCREAAAELARCDMAWESAWAPEVVGPELEKAREIHRRWKSYGHQKSWGKRPRAVSKQ